jgi:hypothetical protein
MNPYLEDPAYWLSFHNELIFCIHEQLSTLLPAGYRSSVEQRLAILPEENIIRGDVTVTARRRPPDQLSGGTAVAERGTPSGIAIKSDDFYEWYVEIRTARSDRRVVTIIEVLSPSNKAGGTAGADAYRLRQRDILRSATHLIEIDLLRGGEHTVAAPSVQLPPRTDWDYCVSLYRAPDRNHFPYWLFKLSDPLPEVQVPLLPGDADVILDLQAAFDHAFRAGRYADDIDTTVAPPSA